MKNFLLLLLIFFIGCASSKPPKTYKFDNFRLYNTSLDSTWEQTLKWFSEKNIPISTTEKFLGHIATEYYINKDSADKYLDCGVVSFDETIVDYMCYINVYVKELKTKQIRVSISINYSGMTQTKIGVPLDLGKTNCNSKGVLEKDLLDFVGLLK